MEEAQTVSVAEVVKVLIDHDPILIRNWKTFYQSLGLNEGKSIQLDFGFTNMSLEAHELFVEILQAWVSKCGDMATMETLILLLRQEHFNCAADRLNRKWERYNQGNKAAKLETLPSPLVIRSSQQLSSSSTNPKHGRWYKIKKPNANFKVDKTNLESLEQYFKEQLDSKIQNVVVLKGDVFERNSELARKFASDVERSVNCIWLDGNNLEFEFKEFLRSEFEMDGKCSDFSNAILNSGCYPCLCVFDKVCQKSVGNLQTLLKEFGQAPPGTAPFIIIITRYNNTLDFQTSAIPNLILHSIRNVENRHELYDFIKSIATPWVKGELSGSKNVEKICLRIEDTFKELVEMEIEFDVLKNSSFSLMMILAYAVVPNETIDYKFLLEYWALLSFNEFGFDRKVLNRVLKMFAKHELLQRDTFLGVFLKILDSQVLSVIKQYLGHPGLNLIIQQLVGMPEKQEKVTPAISVSWLFTNLLKLHNTKVPINISTSKSGVSTYSDRYAKSYWISWSKLVDQVLNYDSLLEDFKELDKVINYSELPLAVFRKLYTSYIRAFGPQDKETLKVGGRLASRLYQLEMYTESAELLLQLHNGMLQMII